MRTKVLIICPFHGKTKQTPDAHLNTSGCNKCGRILNGNNHRYSTVDFISLSNRIHNYTYNYDNTTYININTKVNINCPKHGEFKQKPSRHLQGRGCSKCVAKYSKGQIEWLCLLSNVFDLNILHAENIGEYNIPNSNYKADGFSKNLNLIFEYHGCFFHGCITCCKNKYKNNPLTHKPYEKLYKETEIKKDFCVNNGFNYFEIWECEWKYYKKNNIAEYLNMVSAFLSSL